MKKSEEVLDPSLEALFKSEFVVEILKEDTEVLQKAKSIQKDNISDLLEKGLDCDLDTYRTEELFKVQKMGGAFSKSFNDTDMAEALNLDEKEAEEILGK